MAQIAIENYKVDIFTDSIYNYSENDNTHKYDFKYLPEDDGYISTIGIKISKKDAYDDDVILKSALIGAGGGATVIHKNSFVYELHKITICCADAVFCLSLPDLSLLWKTKADFATCFEIFKLKDDYIVHGELEITRLGKDGRIIWQQSGADIFVTLNSKPEDFAVTDNYILATDWENRKYKFDFDGNIIL